MNPFALLLLISILICQCNSTEKIITVDTENYMATIYLVGETHDTELAMRNRMMLASLAEEQKIKFFCEGSPLESMTDVPECFAAPSYIYRLEDIDLKLATDLAYSKVASMEKALERHTTALMVMRYSKFSSEIFASFANPIMKDDFIERRDFGKMMKHFIKHLYDEVDCQHTAANEFKILKEKIILTFFSDKESAKMFTLFMDSALDTLQKKLLESYPNYRDDILFLRAPENCFLCNLRSEMFVHAIEKRLKEEGGTDVPIVIVTGKAHVPKMKQDLQGKGFTVFEGTPLQYLRKISKKQWKSSREDLLDQFYKF